MSYSFLPLTPNSFISLVSEPGPTMDTRGKMNVEFRNDVNEILARHDTSFDQVNAVLQEVLTELQALRASHNQNTSPCDDSSHPYTSRSHIISDHLINTSSCPSQNLTVTTQLVGFTRQNSTLNSRTLHQNNKFIWPPSI